MKISAYLRRILSFAIPLCLFPALVASGVFWLGDRKYAFISIVGALFTLILFFCGFSVKKGMYPAHNSHIQKRIASRRLVLVSILTALTSIGRLIPFFKPIAAITTLTAIYLGGEAGFFVGAMSALISNFLFGQGPWTPFQMLAWGLIGYFAGWLSPMFRKSRTALFLYGALSGVFFSLVMDVWTVLWGGGFSLSLYIAAIITAVPHTILYAVSNVLFLLWFHKPFCEKLTRIQQKYGI